VFRTVRSQSGAVTPGTVIALAFVGLVVWIFLAAFEADTAHHGKVPIPSTELPVELPEGEVGVYYAEGIPADDAEQLTLPEGLAFTITDEEGNSVRSDSRGGDPEGTDDGAARVIGSAFVPADGTYLVTVEGAVADRIKPELTFGQSPLQAIGDRFEEVVDDLKGPTGIIVAVCIVILLMLPAVKRQLDRRESQP
jgi:hypothetical protein